MLIFNWTPNAPKRGWIFFSWPQHLNWTLVEQFSWTFMAEIGGNVPDRPFRWTANVWKFTSGYLNTGTVRLPTSPYDFKHYFPVDLWSMAFICMHMICGLSLCPTELLFCSKVKFITCCPWVVALSILINFLSFIMKKFQKFNFLVLQVFCFILFVGFSIL